jgi:hypothetical protein
MARSPWKRLKSVKRERSESRGMALSIDSHEADSGLTALPCPGEEGTLPATSLGRFASKQDWEIWEMNEEKGLSLR